MITKYTSFKIEVNVSPNQRFQEINIIQSDNIRYYSLTICIILNITHTDILIVYYLLINSTRLNITQKDIIDKFYETENYMMGYYDNILFISQLNKNKTR